VFLELQTLAAEAAVVMSEEVVMEAAEAAALE
jgi:hypothetical protein